MYSVWLQLSAPIHSRAMTLSSIISLIPA
ncbi:hypothetical protein GVI59_14305 [Acetobacter sicerae]|nr:hypothetical protein [Acetobacter sicerae]